MAFICYEKTGKHKGRIVVFSTQDENAPLYEDAETSALIVSDDLLGQIHALYIDANALTARPAPTCAIDKTELAANGVDAIHFTGIEANSTLSILRLQAEEEISGLVVEGDTFTTVIPGPYRLRITCWPFLDWEETVNAV